MSRLAGIMATQGNKNFFKRLSRDDDSRLAAVKKQYMLLIITTTLTGLMAGLFYAWSVSVTPGIGRLSDEGYLSSFQTMNRAIINPLFLICFLGTAVLLPVCTFMNYSQPLSNRFWFLLSSSIFYIVGVIAVTFAGNIPLNNELDRFNIAASTPEQLAALRAQFESKWNMLNHIRSLAATIALVLAIMACLNSSKG